MKQIAFLIILSTVFAGCLATRQPVPPQHEVSVVSRRVVGSGWGNVYTVSARCATNHPDLVDLRFPKRVHLNLIVNGASRRIAYGLPADADRINVNYEYALPWWDSTLLTTNAYIQVTDLEHSQICASAAFIIAGAYVIEPVSGATLVNGALVDVSFFQTGGPGTWRFGYITPDTAFVTIDERSNIVDGTNSFTWQVSLPVTNQIKLAFQSIDEPLVWAVSQIVEVL